MGRGNHFNHKEKGHEPTKPKHAFVKAKADKKTAQYSIDTVGTENERPITIIEE